jgi:hypothetical protein
MRHMSFGKRTFSLGPVLIVAIPLTMSAAGAYAKFKTISTFLSIWWRKSGNLGVSGSTHALIDAIRNGSGYSP